jgi:DNA helicase HerA-like ATPase
MVARAISERLAKVRHMGIFANKPSKTSLMTSLTEIGEHGGLIVFDLSALAPRAQRGVASGLNRIIERFCVDEKAAGTKRYPFVFFEEAHLYVENDDVLNLVTRMRHLGLTSFFLTNRPELLPNAVMSLVDNLFMLNLSSSTDVRAVAKSVLTDQATLEGFAIALPPHHALVIGRVTERFPLVVHIAPLPAGTPASGITQSFWDRVA